MYNGLVMENVCRLQLEMNNDLIHSTNNYQVLDDLEKMLKTNLYKGSDGLWYSRDHTHTHEYIYGTLTALSRQTWFKKFVKVCKVYKEETSDIEDIVEQL